MQTAKYLLPMLSFVSEGSCPIHHTAFKSHCGIMLVALSILFLRSFYRNAKHIQPHCPNPRMLTFQIVLFSMQLVKITTKTKTSHQHSSSHLPVCNEPSLGCQERLQSGAALILEYSQMALHHILTLSNKTSRLHSCFSLELVFIANI